MSNLPAGWIPNFTAPETEVPAYTGDQTQTWAGPGPGIQPKSVNNPAGQIPGIPVMALNADNAGTLAGPQG